MSLNPTAGGPELAAIILWGMVSKTKNAQDFKGKGTQEYKLKCGHQKFTQEPDFLNSVTSRVWGS